MISNFRFVAGKFKKERENENRFKRKVLNLMCDFWYLTRYSSPRLIFSFSAFKSAPAVSEALASGIPCIAVIDTNVKSQAVSLPIPGNDDSLDSIIFYNEIISNFVLRCKFSFVLT
jgi:ribosomal protein S2